MCAYKCIHTLYVYMCAYKYLHTMCVHIMCVYTMCVRIYVHTIGVHTVTQRVYIQYYRYTQCVYIFMYIQQWIHRLYIHVHVQIPNSQIHCSTLQHTATHTTPSLKGRPFVCMNIHCTFVQIPKSHIHVLIANWLGIHWLLVPWSGCD